VSKVVTFRGFRVCAVALCVRWVVPDILWDCGAFIVKGFTLEDESSIV